MEPTIKLNGKEYPLVTPDKLTLGEAADAERITGQGYDLLEGGALALLALVYVSVRRVDPTVDVDDIRMLGGGDIEVQMDTGDPLPLEPSEGSDGNADSSNASSEQPSEATPEPTPEISGAPA